MSVQEYLAKMKDIQEKLLSFLDSDDDLDHIFPQFTDYLKNQNIQGPYLKEFINLIAKISENHCRKHNLIIKTEKILSFLKEDIMGQYSNSRLFDIFKNNKRILLFLIEDKIITIDSCVYTKIRQQKDLIDYFEPELISYNTKKPVKVDSSFEEKRREGENTDYICQLIRKDSLEKLINYAKEQNLNLNEVTINPSIFETNSYFQEKKLISYAAFYGSIEIFKYLLKNAERYYRLEEIVHSNNLDLFDYFVKSEIISISPQQYFEESIECFHNEIAKYIEENLLKSKENYKSNFVRFHNFDFWPNDDTDKSLFGNLCEYDYPILINLMINDSDVNELYCVFNQIIKCNL